MNPFVRFVISILVAGGAVNLLIVCFANAHSQDMQRQRSALQQQQFARLVDNISGHLRRADFVVESQQLDAHGTALQTTLLVRQYASLGSDESLPLPIERVVIPGDQVAVDGLLLQADDTFAPDQPDFQVLRGASLAYFGMIRGKDQSPLEDARFSYFHRYQVPQLTRLDPGAKAPGIFETRLWNYLWSLLPDTVPASMTFASRGLHVAWYPPRTITVRRDRTYTAYISPGDLAVEENSQPTMPGLLDDMLAEGQRLNERLQQQQ